jgi:ribosomal protein L6P/L9E
MRKTILVPALIFAVTLALPAAAQNQSVVAGKAPGMAGVAQTAEVSAKITAVNAATREITLKGPKGNEVTVVAGPEVKNFAQLKVGDNVTAQYVESLVLELKKGGGKPVERTEKAGGVTAKPGEAPGAAAGREITVVGDVINVDAATKIVTVRGPKRTVELNVQDPEQLKLISKGDQIQATYTEAAAISVTPAAKK